MKIIPPIPNQPTPQYTYMSAQENIKQENKQEQLRKKFAKRRKR